MRKQSLTGSRLRFRKSFGSMKESVDVPNLIQLQSASYERFLQRNTPPDKRENTGLQGIFKSVFPVSDYNNTVSLEFVEYRLSHPKYDVRECLQKRGMTYASPLKALFRLVIFEPEGSADGKRSIRDVKEQEVYIGDMPLMTDHASFIINGTERVVVSQIHRSPGVFFDYDNRAATAGGRGIYSARLIPYRGSWLDFEFDQKDILNVRIDRKRKFPSTIFLKACGFSQDAILNEFHHIDKVFFRGKKLFRSFDIEKMAGWRLTKDILDKEGKTLVGAGRRVTRSVIKRVKSASIQEMQIQPEDLQNNHVLPHVLARPLVDPATGELFCESNQSLNSDLLEQALAKGVKAFPVIFFDSFVLGPYLSNTLLLDSVKTKEEAIMDIYRRMKPGEPIVKEAAERYFYNLFFNENSYSLGKVGRIKINYRFGGEGERDNQKVLDQKDIINVVRHLIGLRNNKGRPDDIDHLGNRRIRSVGELLENQYRVGLIRMERVIKERMSLQDTETMMPHDLINAKSVSSVVKEFFGSSQLSQFMDQTNPLAEITHKRRLSTFGPGGLTRERAGFEVRDVHPTHYGRICPIETPEGPNIGLIASMAAYARVNEYGFIETPYRKVAKGRITDDIKYYSALEESSHTISQARFGFDKMKPEDFLTARLDGEYKTVRKNEVDLMDVSPGQLVSIAAALIPFLEHDDANRALMGSNMQRQAVPLMITEAPLVGTGMEKLVARDSGNSLVCGHTGIVEDLDASRVVIRRLNKKGRLGASVDIYDLIKYQRTNQNTCFNQKPIVRRGDRIEKGDIIADGLAMDMGELALGRNVLVAFTSWAGYNFEDSILISEKLIKKDVYTSIHIEEFECSARDTKLGREEITDDIPNVGEEALKNLDTSGIVRIGAKVKPGDILVGRVTPKADSQISPEKKLVLAIFGEKAGDVKDTSLTAPSGVSGTVIDTQIYTREGVEKSERLQGIIEEKTAKLKKDLAAKKKALQNNGLDQVKDLIVGEKSADALLSDDGSKELLKKGRVITEEDIKNIPFELLSYIPLKKEESVKALEELMEGYHNRAEALETIYTERINRLSAGDELLPGVVKMIKVYVAVKRKVEVGDKFAGRHGNKGVISKILPEEDMPYTADGRPIDMVLNPLGVPPRMNIGQILETHLGWAALSLGRQLQQHIDRFQEEKARHILKKAYLDDKEIGQVIDTADKDSLQRLLKKVRRGVHLATPVFDGINEEEIKNILKNAALPETGQTVLFDGRTGEPFEMPVTVGIMYMLKLHHLVEEKIHARSIGPYSLVSQQPLGGKSQFGGQRLGEMEVWAIEAYGAAYCLQEFLTVKSDDKAGRIRMYESIVKGENILEPGIPESFNVLVNEIKSLGLNVELFESDILTEEVSEKEEGL